MLSAITVSRVDQSLPLPEYATQGSVGFDLLARTPITIQPKEIALIPANLIVHTPPGYMLMLVSRSSTPKKKGLSMPHAIGIIDQDYSGPEDELKIQVYNFTNQSVTVDRGDKIAQGIFVRIDKFHWNETPPPLTTAAAASAASTSATDAATTAASAARSSRGGFGSTDR